MSVALMFAPFVDIVWIGTDPSALWKLSNANRPLGEMRTAAAGGPGSVVIM